MCTSIRSSKKFFCATENLVILHIGDVPKPTTLSRNIVPGRSSPQYKQLCAELSHYFLINLYCNYPTIANEENIKLKVYVFYYFLAKLQMNDFFYEHIVFNNFIPLKLIKIYFLIKFNEKTHLINNIRIFR